MPKKQPLAPVRNGKNHIAATPINTAVVTSAVIDETPSWRPPQYRRRRPQDAIQIGSRTTITAKAVLETMRAVNLTGAVLNSAAKMKINKNQTHITANTATAVITNAARPSAIAVAFPFTARA